MNHKNTEGQKPTLVGYFCDLAKEVRNKDPFEFPVGLDLESTYETITSGVLEGYLSGAPEHREEVLLATVIHLTIENFILNYQLMIKE